MIKSLTQEQAEQVDVWRREWHKIGTCTDPADRPRAEAAITKMYQAIGKKPPVFMWSDSPITAQILIHIFKKENLLMQSLKESLESSLRSSLRSSL